MQLSEPQSPKLHANLTLTIALLLGAYSSLLGALLTAGMGWTGSNIEDSIFGGLFAVLGVAAVQFTFVFTVGTKDLVEPVKPARQILPFLVFAAMTFLMLFGFGLAALEFIEPYVRNRPGYDGIAFLTCIGLLGLWIFWLVVVIFTSIQSPRVHFFRRFAAHLLAGSLFQLLLTVPAHMVVSRRPGCFVGLGTMMGIFGGVLVLIFSGGPAVVWVMMHFALTEKEKVEMRRRMRKEAQIAREEEEALHRESENESGDEESPSRQS
jgi:hypothetical protein